MSFMHMFLLRKILKNDTISRSSIDTKEPSARVSPLAVTAEGLPTSQRNGSPAEPVSTVRVKMVPTGGVVDPRYARSLRLTVYAGISRKARVWRL